jgi:hypothetical protein
MLAGLINAVKNFQNQTLASKMICGILLKNKEKNASRKQEASSASLTRETDTARIHSVRKQVNIEYQRRKSKYFFVADMCFWSRGKSAVFSSNLNLPASAWPKPGTGFAPK